nr:MAG TPA: hypothetical protein [Caudoviricetes sp.]
MNSIFWILPISFSYIRFLGLPPYIPPHLLLMR